MEDIDSLEMILNLCLSKAMCRKGRIQHPNSNNIAEFVSNFLKEENLSGSQKVRNSTTPALNLHGVNDWLNFDEADPKEYNNAAANNCQLKFDDGTICRHNDDWPDAILTHFREV